MSGRRAFADILGRLVTGHGRAAVEDLVDEAELLGFVGLEEGVAVHRFFNVFQRFAGIFDIEVVHPLLDTEDFLGLNLDVRRSEEHTSELQSLMRISYAVFCLTKKNTNYLLLRPKI